MTSEKKGKKSFGPGMEVINSGVNTSKVYGGRRCICSPGGWAAGNASGDGCACGCGGLLSVDFAALNGGANNQKAQT